MKVPACDHCPAKDRCESKDTCSIENNPNNRVKKVIAVMSGKGGVGKSTITTLLAKNIHHKGFKVGILDADITGPSIPRLMQVPKDKASGSDVGIIPIESKEGIKVMSLNFLMDDEEKPVIWRGPIISGVVKQFWSEVYWGELDYLLIDMPPGTADVALTVMQSIPINGIVVVTTPHDMVSMIVAKSINMAKSMKVPIIGMVENMSYFLCPDCNKKIQFFEAKDLDNFLNRMEVEVLTELPMSKAVAGLTIENKVRDQVVKESIDRMTEKVLKFLD